jgi:hypothetical protein
MKIAGWFTSLAFFVVAAAWCVFILYLILAYCSAQ